MSNLVLRILFPSLLFFLPNVVKAEYTSGWANIHFDYQDWKSGFKNMNNEQALIGLEGGANFTWGELFGFFDFENILEAKGNQGTTLNGESHYYIQDSGFSIFSKVYSSQSQNIKETNTFLGIGYTDISGSNWWFKPWLAPQYVTAYDNFSNVKNVSGYNGFTLGWIGGYSFDLYGKKMLLTNWNELEFDRNSQYSINNSGSNGVNGGINLTLKITNNISTTVMYRYFYNKLGADAFGDILIYRVAYDF